MADTTTTADPDTNAGHKGGDGPAEAANPANRAPADQPGYDPKDAKWANKPGAAARAGGWPRHG
jgi:hypothetical protein